MYSSIWSMEMDYVTEHPHSYMDRRPKKRPRLDWDPSHTPKVLIFVFLSFSFLSLFVFLLVLISTFFLWEVVRKMKHILITVESHGSMKVLVSLLVDVVWEMRKFLWNFECFDYIWQWKFWCYCFFFFLCVRSSNIECVLIAIEVLVQLKFCEPLEIICYWWLR